MRSFRRLAVGVVGLSLALGGGAAAWLAGADAAVASVRVTPSASLQPLGTDFTIHSQTDTNFCLADIPAPAVPASEASISQCVTQTEQQWTFADAADDSVAIIGGNSGKCLDLTAAVHSYVSMTPCAISAGQRFGYTAKGQIKSVSGKKCLQASQAAQNAVVTIQKCQTNVTLQIWVLSH